MVEPENPQSRRFSGYAAKFNIPSQPLGYYEPLVESIRKGAFKRSLANKDQEVIWNYEHNDGKILGRKSSGTVSIVEDDVGLRVEGDIPETSYGNDIIVSMKRKDLKYMSFAFVTQKDSLDRSTTPMKRELIDVDLYDVAIVVNPAYLQTEAGLRSINLFKLKEIYKRSAFDDYMDFNIRMIETEMGKAT